LFFGSKIVRMGVMEGKYFQISSVIKARVTEEIKFFLRGQPDISFAYLHGSFLKAERFRDIDVAVFLKNPASSTLPAEIRLETELGKVIKKFPVEVRALNHAPLSFRYNVIKDGSAIVVVDDALRCEFMETTLQEYFDFAPFRRLYLKEALNS
jgi:predicted nucleotidyltransferase